MGRGGTGTPGSLRYLDASILGAALEGPHSPSTSSSPAVCADSLALSMVSGRHPHRESRTQQAPCLSPAPPGPPAPQDSQLPLTKQRCSSVGLPGKRLSRVEYRWQRLI